MKIFDIIKDANQSLLRNKLRSFLTILAIFIGSFSIIISAGINAGVNDFIDKQLDSVGGEDYLEVMSKEASSTIMSMASNEVVKEYKDKKNVNENDFVITQEQIEKARKIDGVKSFDALNSATVEYFKIEGDDNKYSLLSVNLVPRGDLNFDISAGRQPENNDDSAYEIAVPTSFAEYFHYDNVEDIIGKKITLTVPQTLRCLKASSIDECSEKIEVEIVGVQAPGVLSIGGPRLNVSAWNKIAEINNTDIPEDSSAAMQATAQVDPAKIEDIKKAFDEIGLTAMSLDEEMGQFKTFFNAVLMILKIFGGIALLAAAIGIVNTLLMSVQERTREIGLDKALGMSNGRVFTSFALEATMLGFWGSIFGITLSIIIGNIVNTVTHNTILSSLPSFQLVIFRIQDLITVTVVIMFIALIAGVLPARKASKKDPIEALRYE